MMLTLLQELQIFISNPNTSSEVSVFKESDIEKMSDREYEVNQEEITKAIQNGKFIYDLTGSARQYLTINYLYL